MLITEKGQEHWTVFPVMSSCCLITNTRVVNESNRNGLELWSVNLLIDRRCEGTGRMVTIIKDCDFMATLTWLKIIRHGKWRTSSKCCDALKEWYGTLYKRIGWQMATCLPLKYLTLRRCVHSHFKFHFLRSVFESDCHIYSPWFDVVLLGWL